MQDEASKQFLFLNVKRKDMGHLDSPEALCGQGKTPRDRVAGIEGPLAEMDVEGYLWCKGPCREG